MEDSLGPPKATVNALIKELSGNIKFATNYGDLIMEISQEYIAVLAAEANKICLADGKKTIAPDHVFRAFKELKLDDMVAELHEAHEDYLKTTEERNKAKADASEDLSNLEEYQRQLFEQSRSFSLARTQSTDLQNPTPQASLSTDVTAPAFTPKTNNEPLKAPQFRSEANDDDYENF